MDHNRTFTDKILLFVKGLAMGAANKVPGVSGGIVAFVVGFYEEFIHSLRRVNTKAFKLLLGGRFRSFYQYVNGPFLSILILGAFAFGVSTAAGAPANGSTSSAPSASATAVISARDGSPRTSFTRSIS